MLFERFPNLTLADQEIVWTPIPLVRGMKNLIVNLNEGDTVKQSEVSSSNSMHSRMQQSPRHRLLHSKSAFRTCV